MPALLSLTKSALPLGGKSGGALHLAPSLCPNVRGHSNHRRCTFLYLAENSFDLVPSRSPENSYNP